MNWEESSVTGISTRHNPEFTSVEIYEAYSDYVDMMNLTEELIKDIVANECGSLIINYQNKKLIFQALVKNIHERYCQKIYRDDFDSFSGDFLAAKQAVKNINVDFLIK